MTTFTITNDTAFCRVKTVTSSEVGDETMMMDVDRGMYYALNPVSSRIWALLEQPLAVQEICDRLLEEYEIEPAVCQQEVIKFLGQLLDRQIVTVVRHETDTTPSEI
ncbi:MAG: PqqD family peptide modification chaperone [Cyanobacteria bacterium J06643_13]